jgi:hypothetical protein
MSQVTEAPTLHRKSIRDPYRLPKLTIMGMGLSLITFLAGIGMFFAGLIEHWIPLWATGLCLGITGGGLFCVFFVVFAISVNEAI